jgi:KipI family sensor histidine kinase inhibitor
MRVLRCGLDAVLVELAGLDGVLGLRAALLAAEPDGVRELVPAARTLLVRYDPLRLDVSQIESLLAELSAGAGAPRESRISCRRVPHLASASSAFGDAAGELVVPVRYDGADLDEVAELTGLTRREVVDRHRCGRYRVAFCGFAPGFAYLTGLDPALRVARRTDPRTRVPAGAVAIADEYTGVYPRPSPGGWRLIGSTDLVVWDSDRDPLTLLPPGTVVRFEEVGG